MATGWAGDGAVQDQIDATVKDGIARVRSKLPQGPGLKRCEECDAAIPAGAAQGRAGRAPVRVLPGSARPGGGHGQRLQPSRQQGQPAALNVARHYGHGYSPGYPGEGIP